MASIRVILLTCRRPLLLRRSLASLLAQTCRDWVCEVHNDAPEDDSPGLILAEMAEGDARFSYHHHVPAWGAVKGFNHVFRGSAEPFVSLLEDDNWWEPNMLARLLETLSAQPSINLAWANMRIWRENDDGSWTDTGSTIWPASSSPRVFHWPAMLQAFDALHSNGAMLFRKPSGPPRTVPEQTPFASIESVRERSIEGGYLLVPQVLANFALTKGSARSRSRASWIQGQLLVAASFFEAVPLTPQAWEELWVNCRRARPPRTGVLLMLALAGVKRREILSRARPADLLRFAWSFLGNLRVNLRGLAFRRDQPLLWKWLRSESAARTAEARRSGWTVLDAGSPFTKNPSPPA